MIFILIGFLLILTGIAIHILKWYFLISGYNTISKAKKENVDTEGLGKLMGVFLYLNGALLLLYGILQLLGYRLNTVFLIGFIFLSTSYLLIKAQKYDGNLYDENGKLREGAYKSMALPIGIVIISFIGVAILMFFSSRPTNISMLDEGLQIHGMYGSTYSWNNIENVRLIDELPYIEIRTNGSAIGPHLKGHFRTREMGSVILFVNRDKPPFIYLESSGRKIIFNLKTETETQKAYEEIKSKTQTIIMAKPHIIFQN